MDGNEPGIRSRARVERKARKWSQKEVAGRVGMSLRAYQAFEKGETTPQSDNMAGIIRVLELADEGDGAVVAEQTRASWPLHIQVFLDALGAWLSTMDEEECLRFIHVETRRIFTQRRT
jgi:transcriptional regulator with XRE-family HTH domain